MLVTAQTLTAARSAIRRREEINNRAQGSEHSEVLAGRFCPERQTGCVLPRDSPSLAHVNKQGPLLVYVCTVNNGADGSKTTQNLTKNSVTVQYFPEDHLMISQGRVHQRKY